MAKLLHIFYHKEGTFSLLCQQVQLITVSPKTSLGKIKTRHSSQTMIFPRLTANFITQELLTMTSYAQKSLPYFYSVTFSHAIIIKYREL